MNVRSLSPPPLESGENGPSIGRVLIYRLRDVQVLGTRLRNLRSAKDMSTTIQWCVGRLATNISLYSFEEDRRA